MGKSKLIPCKVCGKERIVYPYETNRRKNIYCSNKCFHIDSINRIKTKCKYCGKDMEIIPSHLKIGRRKYCSKKCMGLDYINYRGGENHPRWNGGVGNGEYGYLWKNVKIKNRKEKCELCWGKTNGLDLDVHHIDLNKKNHDPNNLITLCRSCHSKLHSKIRREKCLE